MKTKHTHPGHHVGDGHPPFLRAYFEMNQLKLLLRQGWLTRAIHEHQCESVAEHSFGVAFLAMLIADAYYPELDALKILRMALLHDLGEVHVGDLTPAHGVAPSDKTRQEKAAVTKVLNGLSQAETYLEIWEEYEEGSSPEARLVKSIDRLEMALQARVYECQFGADLNEFYASAEKYLQDPKLRPLFDDIMQHRDSSQ